MVDGFPPFWKVGVAPAQIGFDLRRLKMRSNGADENLR